MSENESRKALRLRREIESFAGIWPGGFYEGDPLDPMGRSSYNLLGYMSVLHAVYLTCIKPYVTAETRALEIGPGRGAWTRTLLPAREVWCLDALPAEHNRFWEYVGRHPHVRYLQVRDFDVSQLPDAHFDYLFSFGTFCHISFEGIAEYLKNLRPKLLPGAHAFVMIADYEKYNRALDQSERLAVIRALLPEHRLQPLRRLAQAAARPLWRRYAARRRKSVAEPSEPRPGRWYHAGVEPTCRLLESLGYRVVDPDVGAVHRDAIVHFTR